MEKKIGLRPYARLLTMLGNQLIKNERIAVMELIKNSYDADADWVKVSFENFTESLEITSDSKIVIEDNGCGMTEDIIERAWMSPATPNKLSKEGYDNKTLKYKRVIQGEKGIGRFAMLKLGKTINMTTRPAEWLRNKDGEVEHNKEFSLRFDLNCYDNDFIDGAKGGNDGVYLDELGFVLNERKPEVFVERDVSLGSLKFPAAQNAHGTRIEISNLSGSWSLNKIQPIKESFIRFSRLFDEDETDNNEHRDFVVELYLQDKALIQTEEKSNNITLRNLIENSSVLRITNGHYSDEEGKFTYQQNDKPKEVFINDDDFRGIRIFRDYFTDKGTKTIRKVTAFGDFEFDFYVFDLNTNNTASKYHIPKDLRGLISAHRIYLLRDNIRVLPYGDPDDDWLQLEVRRGTVRAGDFFSNSQVIGRIKITKKGNPHLKDKTNREGLIEEENYTGDFICIIQTFLSYLRKGAYAKYLEDTEKRKRIDDVNKNVVDKELARLRELFKEDKSALLLLSQLKKTYDVERKYLNARVEQTESLAAVGLSVETASHDIMMMLNKGLSELCALYENSKLPNFNYNSLTPELEKMYGVFSYVQHKMKDIQLLFTSSKQRRRQQRVKDILDKVLSIYKRTLATRNIKLKEEVVGSPLMAKCTDADLLQLLINLLDNSIYWLEEKEDKRIIITLDGDKCKLIFSDNGPGVSEEDAPYIFEPFYSGKGEEGRGLGLYISRRLMERNDYTIDLVDISCDKILDGANFVVNFIKQERDEY